jgi:sensor c-di-GMP phosphodiesterase-like protein
MYRRGKIIFGAAFAALLGICVVFSATLWLLWRESVTAEEAYAGGLAAFLGKNTEHLLLDARDMLNSFDQLADARCSSAHLQAMRDAAISRPYVRGIGYWQTSARLCDVGFLPQQGLRPAHADRVFDSGVIAWWPSAQTQAGGVQLFLMRYGDHDVAIDPRRLLDLGTLQDRQAVLWVDKLRMSATPWDANLPPPQELPVGVTIDREHARVLSHFQRDLILPIDVVAVEPLDNFWNRHAPMLAAGAAACVLLIALWIYIVLRLSRRELSLASELRLAIARGQISVHYQPVMDLISGRCVGAEALARWRRDNGVSISPGVFVPAAEQAGLSQELTMTVLRTTARDLKSLAARFPHISVNLNLAPDDLKNDRIGAELTRILADNALPAASIKLEITERALVNSDTARVMIRQLRSRGHKIAVDDFGTGYSSLSYLQSFELDVLKIDKTFVDAIGMEAATSQVIVHVIEMAKSLGLDIVAEGVETHLQAGWLIKHGVAYAQGYLFSEPLAKEDFVAFLAHHQGRAAA